MFYVLRTCCFAFADVENLSGTDYVRLVEDGLDEGEVERS